jgi:hypothetical protein
MQLCPDHACAEAVRQLFGAAMARPTGHSGCLIELMFESAWDHGRMAGGMNKRGTWGSMTDRVKRRDDDASPASAIKRCWVTDQHGHRALNLIAWNSSLVDHA